jgi:hypothetical protein
MHRDVSHEVNLQQIFILFGSVELLFLDSFFFPTAMVKLVAESNLFLPKGKQTAICSLKTVICVVGHK